MIHKLSDAIPVESELLRNKLNRICLSSTVRARPATSAQPFLVDVIAPWVTEPGVQGDVLKCGIQNSWFTLGKQLWLIAGCDAGDLDFDTLNVGYVWEVLLIVSLSITTQVISTSKHLPQ